MMRRQDSRECCLFVVVVVVCCLFICLFTLHDEKTEDSLEHVVFVHLPQLL